MRTRFKLLALAMACTTSANSFAECSARNFSNTEYDVISAYIAYYGRVPDAAGLAYWADRIDSENGSLSSIIDAFGNSEEFTESFSDLSNEELINNLFQQAFGRDADEAGMDFYLGELESGNLSLQQIALSIVDGAINNDSTVLTNRINASRHYVTGVESSGFEIDISDMKSVLTEVGFPGNEADQACSEYDILLAEAAQDTTGKSCDNGNNGEPVKKVGQLSRVSGLSYYSEANASLGGIKKTITGVTSATGQYEYYEACGESSTVTFCTGVKKSCEANEVATGVIDPSESVGSRIIGLISGSTGTITLKDVLEQTYPSGGSDEILTNVYQLLSALDDDGNPTNGFLITDETRELTESFADNIDFSLPGFDQDPFVLGLVRESGSESLPSEEKAQTVIKLVEYQTEATTPFDASQFDDFLLLSEEPSLESSADFVGVNFMSFPGYDSNDEQFELFDGTDIEGSNIMFSTLLNNDFNSTDNPISLDNSGYMFDISWIESSNNNLAENYPGFPGVLTDSATSMGYLTTWQLKEVENDFWTFTITKYPSTVSFQQEVKVEIISNGPTPASSHRISLPTIGANLTIAGVTKDVTVLSQSAIAELFANEPAGNFDIASGVSPLSVASDGNFIVFTFDKNVDVSMFNGGDISGLTGIADDPVASDFDGGNPLATFEFKLIEPQTTDSAFPEANAFLTITNDPSGSATKTEHLIRVELNSMYSTSRL